MLADSTNCFSSLDLSINIPRHLPQMFSIVKLSQGERRAQQMGAGGEVFHLVNQNSLKHSSAVSRCSLSLPVLFKATPGR